MSFFSEAEHKFQVIAKGQPIPTEPFLKACTEILPFIEMMGPHAFRLPKADINGHIQRIQKKYEEDPVNYGTLQGLVEYEVTEEIHQGRRSCTTSLLWLKRILEFVGVFLEAVLSGEEDLVKCANKAYEDVLKRYHGWIIRGIFHVIPYRSEFIAKLKKDPALTDEELYQHMRDTIAVSRTNTEELCRLYTERGLDSQEQVNSIMFKP